MTTIIIPTHNRPEMLRTVLLSIAKQSAIAKIEKIIVSENGGCIESGQICEQFIAEYRLPIQWVWRDGDISAIDHARLIWAEHRNFCNTEFTAICHDDDWWTPGHLANAIHALTSQKQASFYGCSHFDVYGESSPLCPSTNMFGWFASDFATNDCAWVIPSEKMIVASILGLICHYSAMVMRTSALKKASYVFEIPDANFDNDRMLQYRLSQLGAVIYNPMPGVFIRQHENRDCLQTFPEDERISYMRKTTRWIVKESGATVMSILNQFAHGFDICPDFAKRDAVDVAAREWVLPELRRALIAEIGE